MSKLTLDEVIRHEKREAEYQRNIARQLEENGEYPFYIRSNYKSAECHEQLTKWLEELKQYKDAEEQGKLMKLPCKPGDAVYRPVPYLYRQYTKMVVAQIIINEDEVYFKTSSGGYWDIETIGKSIFLTKEEAEQVIKSMESED